MRSFSDPKTSSHGSKQIRADEAHELHNSFESLPLRVADHDSIIKESDAASSLLSLMSGLAECRGDDISARTVLSRIVSNRALRESYGAQLHRELFLFQHREVEKLTLDTPINRSTLAHLTLCSELLTPEIVREMSLAERSGWLSLVNKHLALLSFQSHWNELPCEHLTSVIRIARRMYDPTLGHFAPGSDIHARMVSTTARFLGEPFKKLIQEYESSEVLECATEVIDLAGILLSPNLLPYLKDCFLSLNRLCTNLSPDQFGGDMTCHLDEESDEDLDGHIDDTIPSETGFGDTYFLEEDGGTAVLEPPDSEGVRNPNSANDEGVVADKNSSAPTSGYVIGEQSDLSFDDHYALSMRDTLETLSILHSIVLGTILETPEQAPLDPFWRDVCFNNCLLQPDWFFALSGVVRWSPSFAPEVISELARISHEDESAVVHLINLMTLTLDEGSSIIVSPKRLVIDAIKELPKADQREVVRIGKELLKNEADLFFDSADAKQKFQNLRDELRLVR